MYISKHLNGKKLIITCCKLDCACSWKSSISPSLLLELPVLSANTEPIQSNPERRMAYFSGKYLILPIIFPVDFVLRRQKPLFLVCFDTWVRFLLILPLADLVRPGKTELSSKAVARSAQASMSKRSTLVIPVAIYLTMFFFVANYSARNTVLTTHSTSFSLTIFFFQ